MATGNSLAEVSEAVGRGWKVYELGWVHDHSNHHFLEFGNDIKNLAQSLNNIVRVVENARLHYQQHALRSPHFRGLPMQKEWELSTLYEIAGPFKSTLDECEELLIRSREGYGNERTLLTQPKVDDLQKRLRGHNFKISILLKPLEIKLLAGIRQELGTQTAQDAFGQALPALPISGLLILDIDQAVAEQRRQQPIPLAIPAEIESKIRANLAQSRPEIRVAGGLPLQTGVEAFINYFEQSTKGFKAGNFLNERTPSPKQYINLLNCLMILLHLQEGDELKLADQNSLWPVYIAELTDMLRSECQRFTDSSPQRLVAPDMASLICELSPGDSIQNKENEISNLMSPHFSTDMDEVYKVPLPSPQESLQRELTISRIDSTKLQLVESIAKRETPSIRLGEIGLGIDLKTIQLTPLYAIPSSRPKPLEVLLHTGTSQLNPSFVEPKHVLRLQHLLTGYKVYDRYDQAMVKVSFFIAGQSMPLEEHGRIQLWLPQPFIPVNKASDLSPSPSDAYGVARQGATPTKQDTSSISPSNRTGFIKKRFPGLRRNSGPTKSQSNGSSMGSSGILSFSHHSGSPSDSPTASNLRLGNPSTMKERRTEYPFRVTAPHSGPFELPAESVMARSPDMVMNGLYPVSPNQTIAKRATGYSPLGQNSQFAKEISAALPGYNLGSPISPDTLASPTSTGYPIYSSNNVSQGLQPPSVMGSVDRSPANSTYALPPGSSNFTPYGPNDLFSQGVNEPPTYSPPAAASSKYNPSPLSRSSHISPSIMSTMSTRSRSSLAPTVSTIKTSSGNSSVGGSGIARLHQKPKKPLLVLFLKSRDASAKLSIVAIQIDTHTSVKRERCECYNSHSSCRISCLERGQAGGLLAQRWEADSELTSWNLAKLSEWQWKEGENIWPNVKRVSMKFEKMEDRYKFAGSPCSCNVKTTHELSRCNLESHNGLFGIVKQIGEQMLRTYYNQRDNAVARSMVLGPLLEGEDQ